MLRSPRHIEQNTKLSNLCDLTSDLSMGLWSYFARIDTAIEKKRALSAVGICKTDAHASCSLT